MKNVALMTVAALAVASTWCSLGADKQAETSKLDMKTKQPERAAIVFLIAGQSNAGGVATFSKETNVKAGVEKKHPVNPGTTAKDVGIPTTKDAYPRSHIWKPGNGPFEPLTPGKNLRTAYRDPWRHGIELPMAMLLEKKYPTADIYFVKHGPPGHNLHTHWKAGEGGDYKNFIGQYKGAMEILKEQYGAVTVLGLYWDQGESDKYQAKAYEANLRALFEALRKDTGLKDLPFFVREQGIFQYKAIFKPIVTAQVVIAQADPAVHLLTLDKGSLAKNYEAWAWSIGNGHLSSKAYLKLSEMIMALIEKK